MSLRNRFGRLWGRSSDSSPRASEEHPVTQLERGSVHSEAESHLNPGLELRREPLVSPRKLHKAVSTTFQAFSDSLRSRAQAFYSSPSPAEIEFAGSPEPKTPKASRRRAAKWSSARSRGSRSTRGRKSSPEPESEAPAQIDLPSIGPAPRLDMDFPSSSLRDSNDDDNVTTPPLTSAKATPRSLTPPSTNRSCYKPQKQWPSPHMHLRSLALVTIPTPSPTITPAFPDQRQHAVVRNEDTSGKTRSMMMPEVQETAAEVVEERAEAIEDHEAKGKTFSDDTSCASETESNTRTIITSASTAGTAVSRTSSLIKTPHDSGRVFERGAQSNEDFRGVFWPAGKVIRSSKRCSRSSTGNEIFLAGTGSSHGHVDPFEQVPGDQISEVPTSAPFFETPRVISAAYEADTEADTSSPRTASMGSRAAWVVARADRAKRYAALQLEETNVDTSTDEDSELGVKLNNSLSLTHGQEPSGEANEQVNHSHVKNRAPQKGLEARFLQQNFSENLLGLSEELNPDMSASSKIGCSANISHNTDAAPVVSIDEYLDDKSLRHKLLDGRGDFVLEETLDKQDRSTLEDRFLVTCQLDLEDPFEAAVASFGCPQRVSCKRIDRSDNDVASEGCFQPDSPRGDLITESPASMTDDPACSITLPLPSVYAHTKRVHPASGLMNSIRRDLISKQGPRDGNWENGAKTTKAGADISSSLQENEKNAPEMNELLFGKDFGRSSPFKSTAPVSTDNWEEPTIRYGAASSFGRGTARGGEESSDGALALGMLTAHTSVLSISSDSSDSSPRLLQRRKQRRRGSNRKSSSGVTKRRNRRSYGKLPSSSGYRKHSRTGSYASPSKQGSRSRTPSCASTSRNGSFDRTRWLEAHYRTLEEQISRDSARAQPKEPRRRLADLSMVKRRQELKKKASFEALCQFIYQCERESEAEQAKQSQEEAEEGYTSAMFQGQ
ncbi:MAG: hypothetical protein Q9196_003832 [Gyalolechia fulgens]